ncbi:glutamate 5-kinase [Aurantiacibacter rhizosphaerae]|uniref:Glutamate 5-kinase n=1 Tax=Aurantiacibacter rhizosphaerae TaxID=2691582 RepID=A0A844XD24_9SPHN|nr:glutamate 5-kinase [Aurantiacibacter rhizosphaerae]MWV27405.1 glutamate 5-kinase [Aurantiacibacter rhizosphaerae]
MPIETLEDFRDPEICRRLVIKIGSALLVDGAGQVRVEWLRTIVNEIVTAQERGQEVVVVSSGAIAIGGKQLNFTHGGRRTLAEAQASASVGQIALASTWSDLLTERRLVAAQLLLTLDDFEHRRRYLNISATLRRLLKSGVVPVVNENDTIATGEIRFGDNDRLAARVAQACDADGVMLLTDVDGLYDRHPDHPDAERLEEVRGVTDEIHAMADGGSGSGLGSGGMTAKLLAAEIAERAGIALAIIDGQHEMPMARALAGQTGTLFLPKREDTGRRAWIGGRMRFNGALTVDDGCVEALQNGKSVLATGIIKVEGEFERGDILPVYDESRRMIAKGVVEYDWSDVIAIRGHSSEEHEDILGHTPRSAVIHRDHLVLL